jgi:alkylhydroperoxidase family enzyme
VEAVYADRTTAPVSDEVKAALALIETFTLRPEALGPSDVETARKAGLSDEAIEHVFDVATMFNVIDRLADAFQFHVPDQAGLDKGAKVLLRFGYRLPPFV